MSQNEQQLLDACPKVEYSGKLLDACPKVEYSGHSIQLVCLIVREI